MNKIIISVALVVAVVLGGMAYLQSKRAAMFNEQFLAAQQSALQAADESSEKDTQIAGLQRQIERLREDTGELSELRGEVTRLRQENERLTAELASATREAANIRSQLQSTRERLSEPVAVSRSTRTITISQAPPQIRDRIAQQYPGVTVVKLDELIDEGQTVYALHGVSEEERGVHAVINADGEILGQEIEMGFDQVPDPIRGGIARELGADSSMDMIQVWEDGTTVYRGFAERDGQQFTYTFSETGELIGHEALAE